MRRPTLTRSDGARVFTCWPAAVLLTIFDRDERLLLLSSPRRGGDWEVPSGAIEAGETVLQAVLREAQEELGAGLALRPLGTAHTEMFPYPDPVVGDLISITYVLACDAGEVRPADDMEGARLRWATLDEIERDALLVKVPGQPWLRRRALDLFASGATPRRRRSIGDRDGSRWRRPRSRRRRRSRSSQARLGA